MTDENDDVVYLETEERDPSLQILEAEARRILRVKERKPDEALHQVDSTTLLTLAIERHRLAIERLRADLARFFE